MSDTLLFLDTEFTALRQHGQLISIGVVKDRTTWFYAEFNDYDESVLTDWHMKNVIANQLYLDVPGDEVICAAQGTIDVKGSTEFVTQKLITWLSRFKDISVVGDCLAYDWVFFCELLGGSLELERYDISYMPLDIVTMIHQLKKVNPQVDFDIHTPSEKIVDARGLPFGLKKHNALYDAFLTMKLYHKLTSKF